MTSTFRIPKATTTGLFGTLVSWVSRRVLGQVPDNVHVLLHHRAVLVSVLAFERRVSTWDRLDATLKSYAVMASAGAIGCTWCLDFGYYMARHERLDLAKVREVPRWRESAVFSPLERDVMEYAEAMTVTPPRVSDEMVDGLIAQLGVPAVVELTQMIALENMRSRFNSAAGLRSQGFSDVCELPLAPASGVVESTT